ncbi:MAG: bifunctional adenosylcobinamide kinase/adenosylcobinamide-phosphate guanylyltransferase [Pseudomonadota bacterium]
MIHLILGGARSGKSRHALSLESDESRRCLFVATAEIVDPEFKARIERHQQERDPRWTTIESPISLADTLGDIDHPDTLIVVDCLSVWLGNLMHHQEPCDTHVTALLGFLRTASADVRLVSNEVGQGVVPESRMGREFRDLQGRLNQDVASIADRVQLVVAGLPVLIKP